MGGQYVDRVAKVRSLVAGGDLASLAVDDLRPDDLPVLTWSGSALHLESVAQNLRRGKDAVDYLCVRAPDGAPIAKGGVDYEAHPGAGTLWQLAVVPELQRLGIGTRLVTAAEARIVGRGLGVARLGVEDGNDDALRLYRRLGYAPCGRWASSWEALDDEGNPYLHRAEGTELSKEL